MTEQEEILVQGEEGSIFSEHTDDFTRFNFLKAWPFSVTAPLCDFYRHSQRLTASISVK